MIVKALLIRMSCLSGSVFLAMAWISVRRRFDKQAAITKGPRDAIARAAPFNFGTGGYPSILLHYRLHPAAHPSQESRAPALKALDFREISYI
jgi:hypothetical protein